MKHRSALKHRIHSALINFGRPCPGSDLFGVEGRRLLARLELPEPWRGNVAASLALIDSLEDQIAGLCPRVVQSGESRGAKVAQIEIARRLAHAIWHMPPATSPSLHEAPLFV